MNVRSIFASTAVALILSANASAAFFIDSLFSVGDLPPVGGTQVYAGQMGDDFKVGANNLFITTIAVFDDDGDGTLTPLTWQLFEVTSGALIHTQVVLPTANTPGPAIEDNYVFAGLVDPNTLLPIGPITLLAGGEYSVVASGFNAFDTNFNTNTASPPNVGADVDFNENDLQAFGGRYSAAPSLFLPTADAGNSLSTNVYNFGDAAFIYAVPEASSFFVIGFGGLFAVGGVWIGRQYGLKFEV